VNDIVTVETISELMEEYHLTKDVVNLKNSTLSKKKYQKTNRKQN